jgi:Asp/Glu/hydantoin racemase
MAPGSSANSRNGAAAMRQTAPARIAWGGKPVYGARLGILLLEARFPRIPGDMGNAETWPFPVLYKVVAGASPERVVRRRAAGLREAFLDAAAELVRLGADGITTNCGFLSLFQQELAAHAGVPVAASSLMQIPVIARLLPPGKRVGVLTVSAESLGGEHFLAAGADPATPVEGTDGGNEFTRVMLENEERLDAAAAERDILMAGERLVARHPEIGAVVLECTNMAPYARALAERLARPVYDIYAFATWFHRGLVPRDFGPPGSGPRDWRER